MCLRQPRTGEAEELMTVRTLLTALLVAAAAAALATPAAAAEPPRLDWSACDAGFECATASVPLDHDEPRGQAISLALVRLPATDPARRIGTLFLNPGGPGESGVDFLRTVGPSLFSEEVRDRFDLVSFDPRGVARSTPLRCFDTPEQAAAARPPFFFPVTDEEERAWLASDRAVAQACAERGGPILHHMSTANVARDLELLRRAVGDDRLTYAGFSYGSFLGEVYANLFPRRVRALLLDGVADPVAWSTGWGRQAERVPFSLRIRSADGHARTLRQFFALCDRAGEICAFGRGDSQARWEALAARLRAQPAALPDGRTFTYQDLVRITYAVMSDPSLWPLLADALLALATDAETGTLPPPLPNAFDPAYPAVFCSDSDNPHGPGAWSRAADDADRRLPHIGRASAWWSSICLAWPRLDADRYTGPWTRRTANPVLLVANEYDPQTPLVNARIASTLLPRARLLTIRGWGHTSLRARSSCAEAHISRYLLATRLPRSGTVCPVDSEPFAL
jgi:pimeloyl-ACP methyl ester carboxylesterase